MPTVVCGRGRPWEYSPEIVQQMWLSCQGCFRITAKSMGASGSNWRKIVVTLKTVNERNGLIATVGELRRVIIPTNVEQPQKPRLITSRFTALVGVILTGYIAALAIRSAFWQSAHHFHWLLPLDRLLPAWAVLTVNVVIYGWMLWLCVVFPRALQGKERVLVAGWVPSLVLGPIQGMVSVSLATAIQYVKAASMMVAFIAAVVILVVSSGERTAPSDRVVPQ
jgi:hypothetical protein